MIKSNAKIYNRHLTEEYFAKLSTVEKLGLTHPADRVEYAQKLITGLGAQLKEAQKNLPHTRQQVTKLKASIAELQGLIENQKIKNQ